MKKIKIKKIEKTLNKSLNMYIKRDAFVEVEEIVNLYENGKLYGIDIKGRYGRNEAKILNYDSNYATYNAYSNNFEIQTEIEMSYEFIAGMFYQHLVT